MEILKFDLTKTRGDFKPLNAVNNGPVHKRHAADQPRSNLEAFKAAKIPYARNHDASFNAGYGGEHSVDISSIFTDFEADPYAPDSYDFACTDEYILVTNLAGTETFYRLGQKIEHYIKKYFTVPPKDFQKWAVICEHIIRHYNEGWANGFNFGIEYWEIWNEPDAPDDFIDTTTWGGTKEQFFDFYEVVAKHLKKCFPNLKIGGPALSCSEEWAAEFLAEMSSRNVPIDFFSWHCYTTLPGKMTGRAKRIRKMMDSNGYENAESILNEWNYVKGWTDKFLYSIETIIGMKGAAFTMACMSECQKSSVDMLMYYDARPCAFNGMFDFYTMRPLKGYYPFLWFSKLYGLKSVECECTPDDIYTLCGVNDDGKTTTIVTYYTDDDGTPEKNVKLDFGKEGTYRIFELSEDKTNDLVGESSGLAFSLRPNSCLLIEEV